MTIANQLTSGQTPLVNAIGKTIILAYKEATDLLEETLTKEGLSYQIIRQKHQPEYRNYSQSYLVLLNHCSAWEIAAQENQPTLIMEADFVPVIGLGNLPLPFNPAQTNTGIAWLYTCAPQVYSVSSEGYAQGFSTSMVAYIVTPQAAKYLLELATEIEQQPGPYIYSSWDSEVDRFLRLKKLKNYIPFRNYGEHGGLPNLEHQKYGLSKTHRADVLYGKLAFTPMYARGENIGKFQLISVRLQARIKGIGRLVLGKFLRLPVIKGSTVPGKLINFALQRQLSLRL